MGHRPSPGLAGAIDAVDPEVIFLGEGLSNLAHLYDVTPALLGRNTPPAPKAPLTFPTLAGLWQGPDSAPGEAGGVA